MASTYYISGQYPDGVQFRAEVTTNSLIDALALAQGVQKVTTLRYADLFDYRTGDLLGHFSNQSILQ